LQLVLQIRRQNTTYGKAKIAIILKRDHDQTLSESTVGPILKRLMQKGLAIRSESAIRCKRKREFRSHAKSWQYGMKGKKPGNLLQIDHMTVSKNQLYMKHFQAWDPTSKYMFAKVYSNATSLTAKKFLQEFIKIFPCQITSVQIDGGSEFMKEFETAYEEFHIELYVLPPRRPQYNGGVERGNRTFREEFYSRPNLLADSIGAMRYELTKAYKIPGDFNSSLNFIVLC
jgi:putative transposase